MRQCRPVHGNFPRSPCGQAVPWTLALLAVAAVAQLALFAAIQGRPSAAPKEGTKAEIAETKNSRPLVPEAGQASPAASFVTPPAGEKFRTPRAPAGSRENPEAALIELPSELPPLALNPHTANPPGTPTVADPTPLPRPAPQTAAQNLPTPPLDISSPDPSTLPSEELKLLVTEAVRLRRSGDMAGAIGKLNVALDRSPAHPRLLFEMAATYEAMGMTERAVEAYRNVSAMGPDRAGALYPIAGRRLQEGLKGPAAGAEEPLYLGAAEEIPQPGGDGQTMLLRFDIHAVPGATVNPSLVSLPVKFFDLVDGTRTEASLADPPQVRWVSAPVDWKEPGVETVEVTYHLPEAQRNKDGGSRKYLGYRVELYHQDALVDILARPRRLARIQDSNPLPGPGGPSGSLEPLPESLPESLSGPLFNP